ncbi:MAG: hypothetical protein M3O64_02330, partial [Chloroflexota bacterium]|nr:hypothetical protein [Chloroflexota bacterium]
MSRWLVFALAAASGTLAAGAIAFLVLSWNAPVPDAWGVRGYAAFHALAYATVGVVVAVRRRANPIGWLLLSVGLLTSIQAFTLAYAEFTIVGRHPEWPFGEVAAWLGSWIWTFVVGAILPLVLLRFPDGWPLSPRWRAVEWLAILNALILASAFALRPGPLQLATFVDNPYAIDSALIQWLASIALFGFVWNIAAGASVVVRFRRSSGIERQQLKWLALSAVPLVVTGGAS